MKEHNKVVFDFEVDWKDICFPAFTNKILKHLACICIQFDVIIKLNLKKKQLLSKATKILYFPSTSYLWAILRLPVLIKKYI